LPKTHWATALNPCVKKNYTVEINIERKSITAFPSLKIPLSLTLLKMYFSRTLSSPVD